MKAEAAALEKRRADAFVVGQRAFENSAGGEDKADVQDDSD